MGVGAGRTGGSAADISQCSSGVTGRLEELDSLRGLAALSVVFSHFVWLWRDSVLLHSSHFSREAFTYLTFPFSAGHEAVVLFFILSGFVLSIPAINSRAQTYPVFVVRRIFRIYMPYLVAIMVAIAAAIILGSTKTQSQWLNTSWYGPVTWKPVLQHVFFIGQYDFDHFDPPIWSLVYEMRISLIFPLLCSLTLRLSPRWSLMMAGCFSGASIIVSNLIPLQEGKLAFTSTLHYAGLFVVGIYLARQRDTISKSYGRLSINMKAAIAISSVFFYVYAGVLWQGLARRLTHYDLYNSSDLLTALGATGLIVLGLNAASCRRVLLWGPIHALGKMSYSVYLLHFIVMLLLVHLLYGKVPLAAILAICLVVILAVSWTFYRLVEIPFMNLGRKLSGYL